MKLYSNKKLLKKYSRDRSIYKIKPEFVVFPKKEEEIVEIIRFAQRKKLPITPRGGGTGLSGAGIGKGVIIDFSKYMNKIFKIGYLTEVESGCLLKKLRSNLNKSGYMLPSVPLHNDCAIGGNISTRSIGLRTLKYGTIDNQVKSLRGVLADGRIIDTKSKKTIPEDIINKVNSLWRKIKKEKSLYRYLKNRPLTAGGYNLLSFWRYNKIEDVITHLFVGSVGTLMLLTRAKLKLPKYKKFRTIYFMHFSDLEGLQKALDIAIIKGAISIQYADKETLYLWGKRYRNKDSVGALIIAFEERKNFDARALEISKIPESERAQLWKNRAQALPKNEKNAKRKGLHLPSGIDDSSIDPKNFSKFMKDVREYERKTGISIMAFGHLGVGSIHLRPLIDMKKHPEKLDIVGKDIFNILKKYEGALVGEHNSGRCRSRYLEMENKKMYNYMKKLKRIFDPEDLLNPKVMFNLESITRNLGV
jgi:glycolate oxidase